MPLPQSQGAWKGILSRRRGFITPERGYPAGEGFYHAGEVLPPEGGCPAGGGYPAGGFLPRRRGRRFVKALHQKAF